MMYKILFNNEKLLHKDLQKIPEKIKIVIFKKLNDLATQGLYKGQVKKLNNYSLCDYRMRVGDYRILFNIDNEKSEIVIFRILNRSKLY